MKSRKENIILLFALMLILAERMMTYFDLYPGYIGSGDARGYILSGIEFANTGKITIYNEYPTAMIMPGMPVLLGVIAEICGTGDFYWNTAIRIVWYVMGTLTAYYTYKSVTLISNRLCGIFAVLMYLAPNRAWMNNVIMTETPYMLFLSMTVYYLLASGYKEEPKYVFGLCLSFFAAFMFRAEIIALVPLAALFWLSVSKYPIERCIKRILALGLTLLVFVVPWSIRNYKLYDAFIPVTYGEGNPLLLGTLYGEGSLSEDDEYIKRQTEKIFREEYTRYLNSDGSAKNPQWSQYLELEKDKTEARLRIQEWLGRDPGSFLKYYLYQKPRIMLNWVWYWDSVFGIQPEPLHMLSILNMILCALLVMLSLITKNRQKEMLFLSLCYIVFLYLHATSFASDRYGTCIMLFRYIILASGCSVISHAVKKWRYKTPV